MMMEIEVSFKIPNNKLFGKYYDCQCIGEYGIGIVSENKVVDDYYDTINNDIWSAGYKLRLRHILNNHFVTIKSSKSNHPRFSVRNEFEFEIDEDIVDITRWKNAYAVHLLERIIENKVLELKFQLRQNRHIRDIYFEKVNVGILSLDVVRVFYDNLELDMFSILEVEIHNMNNLFILDEICNEIEDDGFCITHVAKLSRAAKAIEDYKSIRKNYVE